MSVAGPVTASLLRRLDWRYLVPTPATQAFQRIVLLGADRDLIDAVLAIGLSAQVGTVLDDHNDQAADLIAVLAPARVDPARLMRALRPGGVLYIEVDRRRRGSRALTPHRLAERLKRHGASITAQYALRPAPDRCELFVPLDDSAALRWFVSSVYVASSPAKLLVEVVLRTMLRSSGRRLGAVAPFHATIAVSQPAAGTVLMSRVLGGYTSQPTPSTAMITHGRNRVAQFAFCDETGPVPRLVLKIPKQEQFADRMRREQEVVRQIREALGPDERDSVPRPHELIELGTAGGVHDLQPGVIAVEDAATGSSLARSCGRWARPLKAKVDDLQLATSWLVRLHTDHQLHDGSWDDQRQAAAIDQPLASFALLFEASTEESELFDATRAAAEALTGASLPVVWEHGDFSIWNTFRDGDRMRVLDWENCRPGLPLTDMIRLATHWLEAVRNWTTPAKRQRGFGELFSGNDSGSAAMTAARASVDRYEAALGIDPRFRPVLLVMSRVALAVRRNEQQRDDGTLCADPRAGNASLGYLSSLAARRATLFPSAAAGARPHST